METVWWQQVSETEWSLPDALGTLRFWQFPSGFNLWQSEIELTRPVCLDMSAWIPEVAVGTQMHLAGSTLQQFGTHTPKRSTAGTATLMRIQVPPVRYIFEEPHLIRHIGVSINIKTWAERFQGDKPRRLERLFDPDTQIEYLETRPANATLRTLGRKLIAPGSPSLTENLQLEALSIAFFAETLSNFSSPKVEENASQPIQAWQRDAVEATCNHIDANLNTPLDLGMLASKVRMTEPQLDQMFRLLKEQTPSEYQRARRLLEAHSQLTYSGTPIKQIAHDLGYAHVSNFTRAYSNHFGESPSRTRTRGKSLNQ